jgi:hypothetical protein
MDASSRAFYSGCQSASESQRCDTVIQTWKSVDHTGSVWVWFDIGLVDGGDYFMVCLLSESDDK